MRDDDFSDVVAIMREREENTPTTISIQEIAAGRLPEAMKSRDRKREFDEALERWYEATEEQVSNND